LASLSSFFQTSFPPLVLFGIAASATLFAFASSYPRHFVLPLVPIYPGGNQVSFANAGNRIASGQLPDRDHFQIVLPGTDLINAALIK
jgi:hypothetical protein